VTLFTRQHRVTSDLIYRGQIINLRVDTVTYAGKTVTREVIEHNGGVIIACQPESDKVVLVKQYRYALDQEIIELPAGRLDKGEVPVLAAQRELEEETGYQAKKWKQLTTMYSAPGFCDELLYFFHAVQVFLSTKKTDEDEETEVIVLSVKEAWQMVINGQIADAKTIAGLAMLV
jgi:ADP-ribose pyrophosphatase